MSDEIPPPPPPFPVARDEVTQPGIGLDIEKLTLKRENMRLRQERNEARGLLADAVRETVPPPTRKQKLVKAGLTSAQWALLVGVAGVVLPAVAKKWPAYADLVQAVLANLGLQ